MSNTDPDETSPNTIVVAVDDLDESTFREALSQLAAQYCKQTNNHNVAIDALELQASVVRAKASGSVTSSESTTTSQTTHTQSEHSYGVSWYSKENR